MGKLIETVTIEDSTESEVYERSLYDEDPATLAAMDWREYLRRANFNQDPDKMCELCIQEQKKKFNGSTPIICNGYNHYRERLKEGYGDVLEEIEKLMSEEELKELNAEFDPVSWFEVNSVDKTKLQNRYYQQMILRCSAKNKSIRCGRRAGKSFSIAMYVLFRIAISTKPLEVLVVAPQITMIDEIRQTIETLANNIAIPNFIVSMKNQPILQISFFNGSLIKGITSGTDGKAARGKRADIIWIDEVDFVSSKAMDAIKGVQLDNPDVEMVYTSTPIGQGNLYRFAQMPITKEFHYPTFANPTYTDEMHATLSDMSDVAYVQEVLAFFGVDEAGVFPVSLIEKAENFYIPEFYNKDFVLNNRERFIVFIGVDWNHDNNGTRIVIVGYDKLANRFFKIAQEKISKLNMTQALAVDTVVAVNREYNADHIICDQGFGTAQVSQLRLKGEEQYGKVPPNHPDIKLVDTVSVDFGSSLTITDPVTHQTMKRNTKQYIVENAQKLLEDGRLALHSYEDNDLIVQMKNYHIANKGIRGNIYKPKNKKIGDHDLDAYMLALHGFELFYSGFIKPQVDLHAAIVSPSSYRYSSSGRVEMQPEVAKFNFNKSFSKRSGVKKAKRRSF